MNNWIDNKKRKPRKGGEYNVVWNLNDNGYPVATSMDYNPLKKRWKDRVCDNKEISNKDILYWQNLPKPPKGIKKSIWYID